MNKIDDNINRYINSHPRETLILIILSVTLVWQSVAAAIGFLLYLTFIRTLNSLSWLLLVAGIILALMAYWLQTGQASLFAFIQYGFKTNFLLWKFLTQQQLTQAADVVVHYQFIYILGFSLLIASLFGIVDLIPNNPHEKVMKLLQQGIHASDEIEVSEKIITKALDKLNDDQYDGTVLGVSKYTGQYVIVPDKYINQVMLVLGTTGGGKTITLRRFYQRAIRKNYPLIIVDGKPDEANIAWIKELADKYDRPFFGFNCENKLHYDPLANGGYTELKDKIICLKDEWENDYYKSIAEDYLQTTLQVLLKSNIQLDLNQIIECLTYKNLVVLTKSTQDEQLMKRVAGLTNYEMKDITGLQAHLNILVNSELGEYFKKDQNMFSLLDVIDRCGVVYFALPALRFPSFSKVLGKLVINDIKAIIDRRNNNALPIFTVFDEFGVFSGQQVLNLVNMGRGKGLHAIFGTQGIADLEQVDTTFKNQVLNCVNTLICHRLNDQESAETISNWIGTRNAFNVTAQLNSSETDTGLGSVRSNKEFIVHPDQIKQGLDVGEAFYVSKIDKFNKQKLRIKLI